MGSWTDKKIEKLKVLWEKGIPTAEIGKRLGFSKNAIVGKVHRLGLSNRNSPIKTSTPSVAKTKPSVSKKISDEKTLNPKKTKDLTVKPIKQEVSNKAEIKSKPAQKNESQKVVETLPKAKKTSDDGVSLMELTSDRCCWPIDDATSEGFHFCGKKVFKNKPYCLEHCAMAYTTTSSSSSSTSKEVKKTE